MKNFFYKICFYLFTTLLLGCSNKVINKSRLLEFHNEAQSIIIDVIDSTNQLKLNTETKVIVTVKNIDPHTLSFSGEGIRLSSIPYFDQTISLLVRPTEKSIKKNNLTLITSYPNGDKIISHRFLIPVQR